MQRFSASQLAAYLEDHKPHLIDVREPWEFEICHIAGSQLVPMRQVPDRLDEFRHDDPTVVICHHGIRSMQVIYFLAHQGIDNTINLDGGVAAWASEVDPQMPTY